MHEHGIVGSQGRNLGATSSRVSSTTSLVPNTSKDGDCTTWEFTLNLLFWGSPVQRHPQGFPCCWGKLVSGPCYRLGSLVTCSHHHTVTMLSLELGLFPRDGDVGRVLLQHHLRVRNTQRNIPTSQTSSGRCGGFGGGPSRSHVPPTSTSQGHQLSLLPWPLASCWPLHRSGGSALHTGLHSPAPARRNA